MVTVDNPRLTTVQCADDAGVHTDRVGVAAGTAYLERYRDAFAVVLGHFVDVVTGRVGRPLPTSTQVIDGARVAAAANESIRTGRVIAL